MSIGPITDGSWEVDVSTLAPGLKVITATSTIGGVTSPFSSCRSVGVSTTVAQASAAGATEVEVASTNGWQAGDYAQIAAPSGTVVRKVAGIGSVIFAAPLPEALPVGTAIVQVQAPGGDTDPPAIDVVRPAGGATFTQGESVDPQVSASTGAAWASKRACSRRASTPRRSASTRSWCRRGTGTATKLRRRSPTRSGADPEPQARARGDHAGDGKKPAALALAGTFTLSPGAAVSCGEDVTLKVGPLVETIDGSRFKKVRNLCALTLAAKFGFVSELTFNTATHIWSAVGRGSTPSFSPLANPVAIGLTIGDDQGGTSASFVKHGGVSIIPLLTEERCRRAGPASVTADPRDPGVRAHRGGGHPDPGAPAGPRR